MGNLGTPLELDIYFPAKNIAFEYQGEQHYYSVNIYSGDIRKTKERDQKKREICENLGN
jgi:hypothetical protein